MMRWLLCVLLWIALDARPAWAHKPSDALLHASAHELVWEVALRDLDLDPGLDDGDGRLTWDELRAHEDALFTLMRTHVRLSTTNAECTQIPETLHVSEHSDGTYAKLVARLDCPAGDTLLLDYDYLFPRDPQHRLIVRVGAQTLVLTSSERHAELALSPTSTLSTGNLFGAGITHILEGIDHLLFLFALLLPAVYLRGRPALGFRPVLDEVLKVVTAFTLAHSLTLSLAAFGLATLPARLVEPAIALSVIVAAVLNMISTSDTRERWPVAYALGLLHGYGLSSTLDDVGLRGRALLLPLFTFNLGVEAGQLGIVLLTLPILYLARKWRGYPTFVLRGASLLIAAIACVWFVERAFDVRLLPA